MLFALAAFTAAIEFLTAIEPINGTDNYAPGHKEVLLTDHKLRIFKYFFGKILMD